MKKSSKCMVAVLLAVLTVLSSISIVGSFAAENDTPEAVAAVTAEENEVAATEALTEEPATEPATEPVVEVGAVKNIEKTSFEPNYITLKWAKTPGATGYYVYICNRDNGTTFTKAATVTSNTVTVKNLSHTTQYWFKISAYVTKDGKTYEGEPTVKKTATQAGTVTGLAMLRSSNVISFDWDRNPKATGYKIYRACYKTDGEYELYKTITDNSVTKFSDTNVEDGRAYYYSVRPYRILYGDAVYHAYHKTIKFICGMCSPSSSSTSFVSRANLKWTHNRWATGYDIYYSTDRYKNFKYLGTTTKNFFNTVRLTAGKKYYFRIQPYKLNGASKTKVVGTWAVEGRTITSGAYGKSVGSSYVEVSITEQRMWLYKNGKLIVDTPVVTGTRNYMDTPKGYFSIFSRARNTVLTGPGYASPVDYWMAFSGGCGIHDASWRSSFGGNIYTYNGSHGCINTPYKAVRTIYNNTTFGTPVIVY